MNRAVLVAVVMGVRDERTGMGGMADLRIDDATTGSAVAALSAAAGRLAPVAGAVKGLDAEVAGVNALTDGLGQADQALAALLTTLGQKLAGFEAEIGQAAGVLGGTDTMLAGSLGAPAGMAPR